MLNRHHDNRNKPGAGSGAGPTGPEAESPAAGPSPRRLRGVDLLTANVLAVVLPFLMFRFVMLKAFQAFNLRVSSDELWWNVPALVRQDLLFALGVGGLLTVPDLLGRLRSGRPARWLRGLSCVSLPLVIVLIAGLYAVYLDLGFFPSLGTVATYLRPGSPLLKTAGTFASPENLALVAALLVIPLAVKLLCLRYRRPARVLGGVFLVLLAAGAVWPTSSTLAGAGVHPFGQMYDSLVQTEPDWDLARWSQRPLSHASISGTSSVDSFEELRGAFADHNVLMVLMESTSRLYLCDAQGRWRYPNLARLAAAGMDFSRYYTPGDASLSSLFALFAARQAVPLRCSRWYYPSDGRILWAAELERGGYRTAFFHANSFEAWFDRRLFESMGWDAFEDASAIAWRYGLEPDSTARLREVVDERLLVRRVSEWIEENRRKGRRFFACWRNGIPHLPYDFRHRTPHAVHPGEALDRRQRYENELGYVDAVIGELYDHLLAEGFFEDGLLLLTADHGEAFGQHPGVVVHSTHIYEENVHVPLLVVHPRLGGLVNRNLGSHVDFWPTLADLLGIEAGASVQGRSLLRPAARQMLFLASVENDIKVGVVDGRYKYIFNRRLGSDELFDLGPDTGETRDLSERFPELVRGYRDWVRTFVAHELSAERDPRTLALEAHINLGYEFLRFGKLAAARSHFAEALEIADGRTDALLGLGEVHIRGGRPEAAVEVLDRALRVSPEHPAAHHLLARALAAAGRGPEAVDHARRVLDIAPDRPGGRACLGYALQAAGHPDQAIAELERALEDNPADADAHEWLGRLLLARGERAKGIAHLEACVRIDPRRSAVLDGRTGP